MDAAALPWPQDDPLFDLNCRVPIHPDGPCAVEGLEDIVEALQLLAVVSSARRDARLTATEYDWRTVAEDACVRVVVPV